MSFYNIDFEVKYNDIYNELIYILDNPDLAAEEKYNIEDVTTICTNLYQHELISVFNASSLLDDNIDNGIQMVYDNWLSKYDPFNKILNNAKQHLFTNNNDTNVFLSSEQQMNLDQNSSYFLLLILFSENIFYLTHKCICQLAKTKNIELPLLINLDTLLEETLKNRF